MATQMCRCPNCGSYGRLRDDVFDKLSDCAQCGWLLSPPPRETSPRPSSSAFTSHLLGLSPRMQLASPRTPLTPRTVPRTAAGGSRTPLCTARESAEIHRCVDHLVSLFIRTVEAASAGTPGDMKLSKKEIVRFLKGGGASLTCLANMAAAAKGGQAQPGRRGSVTGSLSPSPPPMV